MSERAAFFRDLGPSQRFDEIGTNLRREHDHIAKYSRKINRPPANAYWIADRHRPATRNKRMEPSYSELAKPASGHLYQYGTVLGVVLAIVSVSSAGSAINAHNATVAEAHRTVFFAEDAPMELKNATATLLQQQVNNVTFSFFFLTATAVLGLIVAGCSAFFWHCRVQRLEDRRRELEVEFSTRKLRKLEPELLLS